MDVDCRLTCHDENYSSLFVENSHPETRPQGVMFHPPWAFVRFTTALRYEPCTQFINVSQRTLHIYFIDGCRRIKIERNNLLCEQAPTEVFRSIFAWLVTLNLLNQILAHNLLLYLRISLRFQIIPKIGNSLINILRDIFRRTQLFTNSFDQIPLRRDDLHICCIKLRHIVI